MTTMHRNRNYRIQVTIDHHTVPHCHVQFPDFSLSVAIENGRILVGEKHRRDAREALEWITANRENLMNEWNRQLGR